MPLQIQTDAREGAGGAVRAKLPARGGVTDPQLPDTPVKTAITFDPKHPLSAEQVAALDRLFRHYDYLRVTGMGVSGTIQSELIDRAAFRKNGDCALVGYGIVKSIELIRGGLPAGNPGSSSRVKTHTSVFTEAHGNIVSHEGSVLGDATSVLVKADLSGVSGFEWRDVTFDLSRLKRGVGEIKGIVRDVNPVECPVGKQFKVLMFCRPDSVPDLGAQVQDLERGADMVLRYFGLEGRMKNILIVDNAVMNAQFNPANPDTIVVYSDILRKNTALSMVVGIHETSHLVDKTLGRVSNGRLLDLHREIASGPDEVKREFFSKINERSFYDLASTGHAADNAAELFASLTSTLFHQKWESRVVIMSPDAQRYYLRCLEVMEDSLRSSPDIPVNAPVMTDLSRRIHTLRGLTGTQLATADDHVPAPIQANPVRSRLRFPQRR